MAFVLLLCLIHTVPHDDSNTELQRYWLIQNGKMELRVSKANGNLATFTVDENSLITNPISFRWNGDFAREKADIVKEKPIDHSPTCVQLTVQKEYLDKTVESTYILDTSFLLMQTKIQSKLLETRELQTSLHIPIAAIMKYVFMPAQAVTIPLNPTLRRRIMYRKDINLPLITYLDPETGHGLSVTVRLPTTTPNLSFLVTADTLVISFQHMMIAPVQEINLGIFLVPHTSDWRGGLAFLQKHYPDYFYPKVDNTKIGEGWYTQGTVKTNETKIRTARQKNVAWNELHYYFPFYGLYVPTIQDWGLIANSDEVSLSQWERSAGDERNSYKQMHQLIDMWHRNGIQTYLYFQCFEAWHQYAKRYFVSDIARDAAGKTLPAWKFTNLMNPDPQGTWGQHIIQQAKEIVKKFQAIDGIFYDRMDYWNYDFAHSDGITMIDKQPAYTLDFAQRKMNDILFNMWHEHGKAIWGNGPTSIEVCKNLDGIMAEKSPTTLKKLQFLCLVRPLIFLAYDRTPVETEKKLKESLVCGAFPSITHGDNKCQELDRDYKQIFNLMYNRTWILSTNPMQIPTNYEGNIFRRPDGDYVAYITNPEKSKLVPHPFDHRIPLTINLPDVHEIDNVYLLSGDWVGVNTIEFKKSKHTVTVDLPCHLASSAIYMTKSNKYDVVRLSSPILVRGDNEKLVFRITNRHDDTTPTFTLELPWYRETKKLTSEIVEFNTEVPRTDEGEIEFKVIYENKEYEMSCWVVDLISIAPKEDIFIKFRSGEEVPFYITNNSEDKIAVEITGTFTKGSGIIEIPTEFVLQPFESRTIKLLISTTNEAEIRLAINVGRDQIIKTFPVKAGQFFSDADLFNDDFTKGMVAWHTSKGTWHVIEGTARGSGPAHFAYVEGNWADYTYEARTRIKGSTDPAVNWLKTYIYFRVQDENNLYRFGIHGDTEEVDLYKRVSGKWTKLSSSTFYPEKNKWYVLKVETRGAEIVGYINNKKVIETTDNAFHHGGIGIGVLEDGMMCDYKEVIVRKL